MGTTINHRLKIVSFLSLWIIVQTNNDLQESKNDQKLPGTNKTDSSCQREFPEKLDTCIEGFLLLHHHLGLTSSKNTHISVIYISIHRDMYCKSYISSLQCIHETLTGCPTDLSTSLVQYRLSQLWALTANQICNINDQHQHTLPNQINELLTTNKSLGIHHNMKQVYAEKSESETFHKVRELDKGESAHTKDTIKVNLDQNENLNSEIETTPQASVDMNMDNSLGQYEPLLKLLQHLLTPAITVVKDLSKTFNTPRLYKHSEIHGITGSPSQDLNFKYETVFLRKLKITNMRGAEKQRYSNDKDSSQSYVKTIHSSGQQNDVVKEFEISTENRTIHDRKTNSTTYKWKTKLKHVS